MELKQQAIEVLRQNDRGGYTIPTASGLYPAQWNWDSCLVALGLAQFDEARAVTEIETLFGGQWPDGMVPHILFHGDDSFPDRDNLWIVCDSTYPDRSAHAHLLVKLRPPAGPVLAVTDAPSAIFSMSHPQTTSRNMRAATDFTRDAIRPGGPVEYTIE